MPTVPIMHPMLLRTTGAVALTDEYSQDHDHLIIYENLLDGRGGAGLTVNYCNMLRHEH